MEGIDVLNVTMRFLHIASMAVILGGLLFIWTGFRDMEAPVMARAVAGYRPSFLAAAVLLVVSGLYNFLYKNSHVTLNSAYHAVFGIKILLVLHVLAAGYLATRSGSPKRRRQAAGAAITGFLILALSAILRRLSA